MRDGVLALAPPAASYVTLFINALLRTAKDDHLHVQTQVIKFTPHSHAAS